MSFLEDPSVQHGGEGWLKKNKGSTRGVLTLESGRVLKSKFDGFNTAFDAMHATLAASSVPDPTLRRQLMDYPLRTLLPRYTEFYGKYSQVQFSKKHMDKYLRYTPETLQALLAQEFSGHHAS
jgi:exocyst complex protein 7